MLVICQQPRIVVLCQRREAMQRGQVAVYGEYAIGYDQDAPVPSAQSFQQHLNMAGIGVPIWDCGCMRKSRASPKTGMRQLIYNDKVVLPNECRNNSNIGEVARSEHACRLHRFEAREPPLQLGKQGMITGYKT